jgi:hypothetical protein
MQNHTLRIIPNVGSAGLEVSSGHNSVFLMGSAIARKSQPVKKSAQERYLEACEAIAKAKGISLANYFKADPDAYSQYRALSSY